MTGDLARGAAAALGYLLAGTAVLSRLEWESRRRASLEVF